MGAKLQALTGQTKYEVRFNFARDAKSFEETVGTAILADLQIERDDMKVTVTGGEFGDVQLLMLIQWADNCSGTSVNRVLIRQLNAEVATAKAEAEAQREIAETNEETAGDPTFAWMTGQGDPAEKDNTHYAQA